MNMPACTLFNEQNKGLSIGFGSWAKPAKDWKHFRSHMMKTWRRIGAVVTRELGGQSMGLYF